MLDRGTMRPVRYLDGLEDAKPADPLEPGSRTLARAVPWGAAVIVTLTLHVGLFWYFTHERSENVVEPTEPAAVMIDMAPETQQAFSQVDAATGKPMEEAVAAPPPPPDPTPDPTPTAEESPTEALAPLPPKPPEKPKVEKKPAEKRPPSDKAARQAAARTTSGPRSDQRAERTTASSSGAATAAEVADWNSQVASALNRNKRYPGGDASGDPVIRMSVAASGAVTSVALVASSGSSTLDADAVDTVHRASPFPPPPGGVRTLTFRMRYHRG